MVAPWLFNIHKGLHSSRETSKTLRLHARGKWHETKPAGRGCWLVDVGDFRFITQNPATSSKWAEKAREGKQVTQVLRAGKYYGVIVGDLCYKYTKEFDKELLAGQLK